MRLNIAKNWISKRDPINELKYEKLKKIGRTPIINTPGLTSFFYSGVTPTNVALF